MHILWYTASSITGKCRAYFSWFQIFSASLPKKAIFKLKQYNDGDISRVPTWVCKPFPIWIYLDTVSIREIKISLRQRVRER